MPAASLKVVESDTSHVSIEQALVDVGIKPSHLRGAQLRATFMAEELPTALKLQGLGSSEQIAKAYAIHAGLKYWSFQRLMVNDYRSVEQFRVQDPLQGLPVLFDEATNRVTLAVPSANVQVGGQFVGMQQDWVIASTRALQHAYRRTFAGTDIHYRTLATTVAADEKANPNASVDSKNYRRMFVALLRHSCYVGANDLMMWTSGGVGNIRLVVDGVGTLFDVVSEATLEKLITIAMRATGKNEDNIRKEVFGEASFEEADLGQEMVDAELRELRGEFDFRLNFGRAKSGPTLVTRFLARDSESLEFDQLGIDEQDQRTLRDALATNSGLIVITGPTGSSKTTTLFSMICQIDPVERSIQTIENPVEYTHPLLLQYETRGEEEIGTEKVFRGELRNAPDVINVAEVRTAGTAHIMVRAAATGHLVLSTLHTDDAPLAVYMLRKLGVDDEDLAANLQIVLGVRLLRQLCKTCRIEETRAEAFAHIEALETECDIKRPDAKLYTAHAAGCAHCTAGFRSRFLVYELLEVREELATALRKGASAADIRALGIAPQRSLRARGLAALHQGNTSIEELIRVLPRRRY